MEHLWNDDALAAYERGYWKSMGLTEDESKRAFMLVKQFNHACERLNNTIHAYLRCKGEDGELIFVIDWGVHGDRSIVTEKRFIAASAEFIEAKQ